MPWGGRRLAAWLDVPFPEQPVGEGWLLTDHELHTSHVAAGPLAGTALRHLVTDRAIDLLGKRAARFPLLVKLLDARENLSVQVHPDDAAAERWAPQEGGKTEAWLVLEADPDAAIYLGLKPGFDRLTLARELAAGAPHLCLQRYTPKPGDCYFVPAGTIHALGGGLVVLEVQQTSDATFRLFDWGRVDAHGKPRALHLEAGLACLQESPPGAGLQTPRPDADGTERLLDCPFFRWNRARTAEPLNVAGPAILVGQAGSASVAGGGQTVALPRGGVVLVPASVHDAQLHPQGEWQGSIIRGW
jgi:mannose-6-phosphate isomerase